MSRFFTVHDGLRTKAQGYDKWAHLAGSATWVCALWLVLAHWMEPQQALGISAGLVSLGGLGIEITQGLLKAGAIGIAERAYMAMPAGEELVKKRVAELRRTLDGFSWYDLLADVAGIVLAWEVIACAITY